jgi:hypothetical protein
MVKYQMISSRNILEVDLYPNPYPQNYRIKDTVYPYFLPRLSISLIALSAIVAILGFSMMK